MRVTRKKYCGGIMPLNLERTGKKIWLGGIPMAQDWNATGQVLFMDYMQAALAAFENYLKSEYSKDAGRESVMNGAERFACFLAGKPVPYDFRTLEGPRIEKTVKMIELKPPLTIDIFGTNNEK